MWITILFTLEHANKEKYHWFWSGKRGGHNSLRIIIINNSLSKQRAELSIIGLSCWKRYGFSRNCKCLHNDCSIQNWQIVIFFCSMPQQLLVGQGPLIEASLSQSVGLLWTTARPNEETSTWQHKTLNKRQTSTPSAGFEAAIPASERGCKPTPQTARLWDRHSVIYSKQPASELAFVSSASRQVATKKSW